MHTAPSDSTRGPGRLLAPDGTPRLWCPPITHYTDSGEIDARRMAAQLRFIAPDVGGLLIAGSTGDGWTLSDALFLDLVRMAADTGRSLGFQMLIGSLRASSIDVEGRIRLVCHAFAPGVEPCHAVAALREHGIVGFTVCGPCGAERSAAEIEAGLSSILQLGVPIALYQLPQVTGYEISPGLVKSLAEHFPNFRWFKDTGGTDTVAQSPGGLPRIFMVRGAEGDYSRWLKSSGGPYDGFLLSTANGFAHELSAILHDAASGNLASATKRSESLSAVVAEVFGAVQGLSEGNPFANANRAIDHYAAHGAAGFAMPQPRFPSGRAMPAGVMAKVGTILERHGRLGSRGYLLLGGT